MGFIDFLVNSQLLALIAGTALGVFLREAVFNPIAEKLHKYRHHRKWKQIYNDIAHFEEETFSVGSLRTEYYILDLEPRGYQPKNVELQVVPPNNKVPEKYQNLYSRFKTKWQEEQDQLDGGEVFSEADPDTGNLLAAKQVNVSKREGAHELPNPQIELGRTSYIHQRAVTDVFQALSDDERTRLTKDPLPFDKEQKFFSVVFCMTSSIVTDDGKLVFMRRSEQVAQNPGKIICGIHEAMDAHMDVNKRDNPDPWNTINRGFDEELGINLRADDHHLTNFYAIVHGHSNFDIHLKGHTDFRDTDHQYGVSGELTHNRQKAFPSDKWESKDLDFVEFAPEPVFQYLNKNKDDLYNEALVSAYFALVIEYRPEKVDPIARDYF